jgi:hypothetical protein
MHSLETIKFINSDNQLRIRRIIANKLNHASKKKETRKKV